MLKLVKVILLLSIEAAIYIIPSALVLNAMGKLAYTDNACFLVALTENIVLAGVSLAFTWSLYKIWFGYDDNVKE